MLTCRGPIEGQCALTFGTKLKQHSCKSIPVHSQKSLDVDIGEEMNIIRIFYFFFSLNSYCIILILDIKTS